jgi:hypothetical protein
MEGTRKRWRYGVEEDLNVGLNGGEVQKVVRRDRGECVESLCVGKVQNRQTDCKV